jgi:hypothetical protein
MVLVGMQQILWLERVEGKGVAILIGINILMIQSISGLTAQQTRFIGELATIMALGVLKKSGSYLPRL